jgi:hypothetical protein
MPNDVSVIDLATHGDKTHQSRPLALGLAFSR